MYVPVLCLIIHWWLLVYRRLYYLTGYFLFLYNAVIGVFSVIKRVLLSLVIGTLLIARMDYVLLMRGFEKLDSGQSSAVGDLFLILLNINTLPSRVDFEVCEKNYYAMFDFILLIFCVQKIKGIVSNYFVHGVLFALALSG